MITVSILILIFMGSSNGPIWPLKLFLKITYKNINIVNYQTIFKLKIWYKFSKAVIRENVLNLLNEHFRLIFSKTNDRQNEKINAFIFLKISNFNLYHKTEFKKFFDARFKILKFFKKYLCALELQRMAENTLTTKANVKLTYMRYKFKSEIKE